MKSARNSVTLSAMKLRDPRISGLTSVTDVYVAPDLKTCKAYISVLGDRAALNETIDGLNSAKAFIRTRIAKTINLRNTPEIEFIADDSIEYGVRMSKLIDDVKGDSATEAETERGLIIKIIILNPFFIKRRY